MKYIYSVLVFMAFSVIAVPMVHAEGPIVVQQTVTLHNTETTQGASDPVVVLTAPTAVNNDAVLASCPINTKSDTSRGMWVWDIQNAIDLAKGSNTKAEELFAFAKTRGIQTLYFNSYPLLINGNKDDWNALAGFISAAKSHCLSVELLGGKPNWYQRQNILDAMNFATQAAAFVDSLPADVAAPTAVHLNVEPWMADDGKEWNASISSRKMVSSQFLSMLSVIRVTLAGSGLALSVDMPYWFETTPGTTSVTRLGKTKTLASHVTDIADAVTVLTFRDSANGITDLSKTAVAYAAKVGKPAAIGVTTKCFADPSFSILTFCGTRSVGGEVTTKGSAYMDQELAKVKDEFSSSKGFGGMAIHYYETYKVLGE